MTTPAATVFRTYFNEISSTAATQVSFPDAVWPVPEDTALAGHLWEPQPHPGWQLHQLFADVLVYFIQKSYARFLEVRLWTARHDLPLNLEAEVVAVSVNASREYHK